MNKKLIYILNQYSPNEGSHFYHVLHLLETIASNDVEIVLIIEKAIEVPAFKLPNITVVIQKKKGIKRFFELLFILNQLNRKGFRKIFVRISQNGAIPAIISAKINKSEVFFWQSGTTHEEDKRQPFKFRKFLKSALPFKIVKKYTNYFVTGPETMVDYYYQNVGVKKEKLICLYNDIDVSRFERISQREKNTIKERLGIPAEKKVILFVKRMSAIKGILFYSPYILEKNIELLREENYVCFYIGDGPEKEPLREEIEKGDLIDIVKVIGGIPNKDIQLYYQIADIFINPTLEEGFPRVLLEAMASGLPTVTTDAGGIKDIIGEKQKKFMVSSSSREDFAIKLSQLLKNPYTQKELAEENLIQAKNFSTESVAKMYIKALFKNE